MPQWCMPEWGATRRHNVRVHESDQIRETFARYGRSMFFAQVLEHGLVNTIVTARLATMSRPVAQSRTEWEGIVEGLFEVQFERTMGQLLTALRPLVSVSTELEALLYEALRARNYLAHSFFRIRASEGMTRSGRDAMIAELDGSTDLFMKADRLLEEALRPLREPLGLTDEALAEAFREMYPGVAIE